MVFIIIIKQRADVLFKSGVIRNLDNDLEVGARLSVVVPDGDGVKFRRNSEIDLHPLAAAIKFHEIAFFGFFIAVGNEGKITDNGGWVRGGDAFAFRQINDVSRDQNGGRSGAGRF